MWRKIQASNEVLHKVLGTIMVEPSSTSTMEVTTIGHLDDFEELIPRTGARHVLVAIEDVGSWWSCELQQPTKGNPDDRDQHALDRAFAKVECPH